MTRPYREWARKKNHSAYLEGGRNAFLGEERMSSFRDKNEKLMERARREVFTSVAP